ncbi:hypothetical protein FGB62_7g322 [Gracilaria domingensis]|nr:hypothetical protein FGB62_7g322 [Gracilaria domingensis]
MLLSLPTNLDQTDSLQMNIFAVAFVAVKVRNALGKLAEKRSKGRNRSHVGTWAEEVLVLIKQLEGSYLEFGELENDMEMGQKCASLLAAVNIQTVLSEEQKNCFGTLQHRR